MPVAAAAAAAFKPFSPALKLMGARGRRTTIDEEHFFPDAKKRVHFNGKIILLGGKRKMKAVGGTLAF